MDVSEYAPPKILVIKLDGIGDFVLVVPFLRAIRNRYPKSHISLVVTNPVRPLAELCPFIDRLYSIPLEVNPLWRQPRMFWRACVFGTRELSRENFDIAFIPRVGADESGATFLAYFSRANIRIGYSERSGVKRAWFNRGYDDLLTRALPVASEQHEVLANIQMAKELDVSMAPDYLELWFNSEDSRYSDALLRECCTGSPVFPIIALCPGAGSGRRQWPIARYQNLVRGLVQKFNAMVWLIGGPAEKALGTHFPSNEFPSVVNLLGATTLRQTVALLKNANLYIGSDSGCMHLAAAVGLPVLEISVHPESGDKWHVNSPYRFGPWGVPSRVVQPPKAIWPCISACDSRHPHCILGITSDMVWNASCDLLAGKFSAV